MSRPDGNPIALQAVRSILEAAHDCTVRLGDGQVAQVVVERLPDAGWPAGGLDGLDPERDGPWPPTILLHYTWSGGSARLRAHCYWWKTLDEYRHLVGISVRREGHAPEVVWITFGVQVGRTSDGGEAMIPATLGFSRRKEIETQAEWDARRRQLRAQARIAGLPLPSPGTVELCRVGVPDGEILPGPAKAFERLATVGLLKLVVLGRGDPTAFEGASPYPLDGEEAVISEGPVQPSTSKKAGLLPLPGGVRSQMDTVQALLETVRDETPDRESLYQHLTDRWNVKGGSARAFYVNMLRNLGLVDETAAGFVLTDAGEAWLQEPSGEALFQHFYANYIGMLELLLLVRVRGPIGTEEARALQTLLGASWESDAQVSIRRNWLLSMGLTDRERARDQVTEAGARILTAYADEAAALLPAIQQLETQPEEVEPDSRTDVVLPPEPDVLDLSPDVVRRHLGDFRPPPRVIDQCCAALRANRHLLLVGPPGTGKTELAGILADAAASEGHCDGLLTTTASADWTTFDTIGGYAMDRKGDLQFRPGVFPTALERNCWLLVDELNRADVDKAFGELMTVLSGKSTVTAYRDEKNELIRIGPDVEGPYRVRPTFRVIATMNTWDKTSLFRLSSALQRRFAVIHVALPEASDYAAVLQHEAGRAPALDDHLIRLVVDLFGPEGLLKHREIGPAVPLDLLRYMRARQDEPRGSHSLAEGLAASLLSQLEGLDLASARTVKRMLRDRVSMVASPEAWADLSARLEELLPSMDVR